MMDIIKANLLDAKSDYILQQNNCLTISSHGLSKSIEDRYSYASIYSARIPIGKRNLATPETRDIPGTYKVFEGNTTDPKIVALFGQWRPGKVYSPYFSIYPESDPPETKAQRLTWFKDSIYAFGLLLSEKYEKERFSIAIPYRIGCGLGGGNWQDYYTILEEWNKHIQNIAKVTIYEL